jgi:hypothetical protein
MPIRDVEIDRRLFKVTVTQQHLNRAKVGTGLQKMSGKAVPQRMRVDLLFKATAFRCSLTRLPCDFRCDRLLGVMPAPSWKQSLLRSVAAPVVSQFLEQLGTEHHLAILAPLSSTDADDHPVTVNVDNLQMSEFRPAPGCARDPVGPEGD